MVCSETPLPEHKTSDDGKGNPTLPEVKSTGVRKAVENVENNTRLSQSHTDGKLPLLFLLMQPAEEYGTRIPLLKTPKYFKYFLLQQLYRLYCTYCMLSRCIDPPFGAPFSMDGRGMHITGWQECIELLVLQFAAADTARPRVVSGVEVEGINTKLGGPEEYDSK